MKIRLLYTAQLKAALGTSEEWIELPSGSTLSDCLEALLARHGEVLRTMLFDQDQNRWSSILPCIGNEQVPIDHPVPLSEGDEITLLSAISGG